MVEISVRQVTRYKFHKDFNPHSQHAVVVGPGAKYCGGAMETDTPQGKGHRQRSIFAKRRNGVYNGISQIEELH